MCAYEYRLLGACTAAMKTIHEYSHLGGAEILQIRHPEVLADIRAAIASVTPTGLTREMWPCQSKDVADQFATEFRSRGFEATRDPYATSAALNQVAFVKQKVYVEVQLGAHPAMFYDLAKFQHFYHEGAAEVAVEIASSRPSSQQAAGGVSGSEQPDYDIEQMKRQFPVAPVSVLLVDV